MSEMDHRFGKEVILLEINGDICVGKERLHIASVNNTFFRGFQKYDNVM